MIEIDETESRMTPSGFEYGFGGAPECYYGDPVGQVADYAEVEVMEVDGASVVRVRAGRTIHSASLSTFRWRSLNRSSGVLQGATGSRRKVKRFYDV